MSWICEKSKHFVLMQSDIFNVCLQFNVAFDKAKSGVQKHFAHVTYVVTSVLVVPGYKYDGWRQMSFLTLCTILNLCLCLEPCC